MIGRSRRILAGPALAGPLFLALAMPAAAFDLPTTHQIGQMLHPGLYACIDGTTPTSEFDILDGNAYFLRGPSLRAGEFTYDKSTGKIDWKSGPFAGAQITAYNTIRIADRKPVIIMHYEPADEESSTEYCAIVE